MKRAEEAGVYSLVQAAAEEIQHDPLRDTVIPDLEEGLVAAYQQSGDPDPNEAIARHMRSSIMQVLSNLMGAALLPHVFDALRPDSQIVARLTEADVIPTTEWEGARYRALHGDEAAIAVSYEHVFLQARDTALLEPYSPDQATALQGLYTSVTQRLRQARRDKERRYPVLTDVSKTERERPYKSESLTYRQRTAAYWTEGIGEERANNGPDLDMMRQLSKNGVGQGELYASLLGCLMPFALREFDAGTETWIQPYVFNTGLASAIAGLRDKTAESLFFTNRRPILVFIGRDFQVIPDGADTRAYRAQVSRVKHEHPKDARPQSDCPATKFSSTVVSLEDHLALIEQIDELTNINCPRHLRLQVTTADICGLLGVGITLQLLRHGIIELDPWRMTSFTQPEH